jgi:hypothetical protein
MALATNAFTTYLAIGNRQVGTDSLVLVGVLKQQFQGGGSEVTVGENVRTGGATMPADQRRQPRLIERVSSAIGLAQERKIPVIAKRAAGVAGAWLDRASRSLR